MSSIAMVTIRVGVPVSLLVASPGPPSGHMDRYVDRKKKHLVRDERPVAKSRFPRITCKRHDAEVILQRNLKD